MSAEEKTAAPMHQFRLGELLVLDVDVEEIELVVEQIDAVENAGGEAVVMAKAVGEARLVAEHPAQIIGGRGARCAGKDQEVEADRIKEQARGSATEVE